MSDSQQQERKRGIVLLVEDEAPVREVLGRQLTAAFFDVRFADNVDAAFEVLRHHSVDAVVADVRFPSASGDRRQQDVGPPRGQHERRVGRSGLEVLQFIRLNDEWHDLPVVILTGGRFSPEEEEIVRRHRAYVFYKPPDRRELVERLIQLTRRPVSATQDREEHRSTGAVEPTIEGRPTVLWQLHHPDHGTQDCLAGRTADGRMLVRIVRLGKEQQWQIFSDAAAAVQWAFELERTLLAQGWEKMI